MTDQIYTLRKRTRATTTSRRRRRRIAKKRLPLVLKGNEAVPGLADIGLGLH